MSDLYTCITCRVAFHEGDSQRQHYKTDWHRYNLKRKVAELPPVNAEEFNNRVIAQRNETDEKSKDKSKYCDCCRKSFNNENSYENHLHSKKHKENEVRKFEDDIHSKLSTESNTPTVKSRNVGEDSQEDVDSKKDSQKDVDSKDDVDDSDDPDDTESVDSDEWIEDNPVDTNICLFCSHRSRSLVRNLRHMSQQHSFFIPDTEFCTDVPGLLQYLGEKVYNGYMCLWCNESGKAFHSVDACQAHMRDQGHTKILHEGDVLLEYADFYDYSSSYPDGDQGNMDVDEEITLPTLDGSDYQLVLPSGAVIGHRSLVRYYKQNVNPNSQMVVALPKTKSGRTLVKVLAQYKSLGYMETKKESVLKKARDIHFMHRLQQKWQTKLSFKANKLQPHFRNQVLF